MALSNHCTKRLPKLFKERKKKKNHVASGMMSIRCVQSEIMYNLRSSMYSLVGNCTISINMYGGGVGEDARGLPWPRFALLTYSQH